MINDQVEEYHDLVCILQLLQPEPSSAEPGTAETGAEREDPLSSAGTDPIRCSGKGERQTRARFQTVGPAL